MKFMSIETGYDNSDGTLLSVMIAFCSYVAVGIIHLSKLLLINAGHIPPIIIESFQVLSYAVGIVASSIVVYKFFKGRKKDGK